MGRVRTESVLQRLMRRSKIPYNKDGSESKSKCWTWTGPINNAGYGLMKVNDDVNMASVHRIMYVEYHKTIQYGQKIEVLHECGNKLCVNPHHLKLGNSKDRAALQRKYHAYNLMFKDKKFMNPICEHCGGTTYRPHFKRKHALCGTNNNNKYNTVPIIRKSI